MTRVGKRAAVRAAAAAAAAGVGLVLGAAGTPAHAAASHIAASHSITVPGLVRHQIDVQLNMSQAEAQSYINNDAKIEIECFGSDTFVDDTLPGVPGGFSHVFTKAVRADQPPGYGQLIATPSGVHLTTLHTYEKGRQLNEDIADKDDVYCKAKWTDRDGHILRARTNMERGYY